MTTATRREVAGLEIMHTTRRGAAAPQARQHAPVMPASRKLVRDDLPPASARRRVPPLSLRLRHAAVSLGAPPPPATDRRPMATDARSAAVRLAAHACLATCSTASCTACWRRCSWCRLRARRPLARRLQLAGDEMECRSADQRRATPGRRRPVAARRRRRGSPLTSEHSDAQARPGQAHRHKVVSAIPGQPIGIGRAIGRTFFAGFISSNICCLGYLSMWQPEDLARHGRRRRPIIRQR